MLMASTEEKEWCLTAWPGFWLGASTMPGSSWAVMFTVILATVGVRAAPGVLIVPLEQAFGWNAATISGAISLNILLGGLVGPFGAALIQRIGMRGTVLGSLSCCWSAPPVPRSRPGPWELYAHLGRAGRRRLGRRHGRDGDRGGKSLVRGAARPGRRLADGEQRQRPARVPAPAGEPRRASWLAERAVGRGAGDPGVDPGRGARAGGKPRQRRPRAIRRRRRTADRGEHGQSGRGGALRPEPRRALGGLLAAVLELRGVWLFDQRAGGDASHPVLHRSRHTRGECRQPARRDRACST